MKEVLHPITVIMLTSESVVVLTGLDQKSWVCYVWDGDGTESKCVQFKDETQTFNKCSRDQDQSRVLQHYFLYNTCLITTFCLYIRVFLHSNIHIGISPKNPILVQPYLCTIKNHKYCLTKFYLKRGKCGGQKLFPNEKKRWRHSGKNAGKKNLNHCRGRVCHLTSFF